MIVGGAAPNGSPLMLDVVAEAGTPSLLDRREMVFVNIGGDGTDSAAGLQHAVVKALRLGAPFATLVGKLAEAARRS